MLCHDGRHAGSIKSKHRRCMQSEQSSNDMSLLFFVVHPCGRATQLVSVSAGGAERYFTMVRDATTGMTSGLEEKVMCEKKEKCKMML